MLFLFNDGLLDAVCREELEKLRAVVKDGRSNLATRRNKMLTAAEEQLNKLNANLSKAVAEVRRLCILLLYHIAMCSYYTDMFCYFV